MTQVSEAQRKTRRRAIGRRMIRKASDLSIMCGDIKASGDLDFLTDKEQARVRKLMDQLHAVGKHLDTLGTKLDS